MRKIIFLIIILVSLPAFAESDCQKRFADLEARSQVMGYIDGSLDEINFRITFGMLAKEFEKHALDRRQQLKQLKSEVSKQNAASDSKSSFIEECLK